MEIQNKRVVLTGAASGIGLALVKEFQKYASIMLFLVDKDPIPEEGLSQMVLGTLLIDLSSPEAVEIVFEKALQTLGGVDIFVANAGFAIYERSLEASSKEINDLFLVNTLFPIRALYKMNTACTAGSKMVWVSSAMAELALPGYALYAASKAALLRFADAYQFQDIRKVSLLTVLPIATRTSFFNKVQAPWPTQTPEKVAHVICTGIIKDRKRVYPSFLYRLMRFPLFIFEFLMKPYLLIFK